MKGVVLAGGSGTRLRPLTHSMAKQLVPVANRPILDYGLTDIAASGIEEVCIIISPQTGDDIRRSVGDGARFGLDVTYVVQDEPAGLAHALGCALPWVDGDDVLMYLGDNLVKGGVADIVADWFEHRPQCQILLTPVPNPSAFGVAELDADGHVVRLVEKPSRPRSDLALVGVYLFDHTVAAAIDAIRPSARGELEITDAIQWLVDNGHEVNASVVRGWWKDTGRREDLLQANALVLRDLESRIDGEVLDCTVRGAVVVEPGARLVDCAVTGPAVVGPDADVRRTEIGPNTAIGPGCDIADARIEGSIVMAGARVHNWSLSASVVGNDSHLLGAAPDEYVQVTLGAHSEVLGQ
jgi:glucose-1-phosphate thymidylyltransferase